MSRVIDRFLRFARRNSFRFGTIAVLAFVATLGAAHPAFAQESVALDTLNSLMSVLAGLAMSVAEFLGRVAIAVLDVTIPVMQYQGFTSSPVVIAGWAIVRDVVNMFFVVVLIVIAMQTIFGMGKVGWRQAVPKLLIFALVINFSKTLCGIMIDFAQVVMLTFANALKDIAGGNFIQLLGLGDIFSLSEEAVKTLNDSGAGTGAFDLFAASLAAVLMMVWVLAVVVMLLFVLVYRVVMLWILIVISPLAWFMGGQSVFKSDAYAEWWKNFICYTAIGPVITFFLWLTLAVAGSGFIAANDPGFSSTAASSGSLGNTSGILTKIFELQRLTSFVVGMAMLMVGFDAAAKICNGVKGPGFQKMLSYGKGTPGIIGGFIGGQTRKYGGKGLSAGWSGGRSVALGAGAAGMAILGGAKASDALRPTDTGKAARAKGMRDLAKKSWMPTRISKSLSMGADERQEEVAKKMKEAAEEQFKGASSETKVDYLKKIAQNGMPATPAARKATLGLLADAMKDPGMREKLEAAGVLGKLYQTKDKRPDGLGLGDELKQFVRNTDGAKAILEFESSRPDITRNMGVINSMDDVNKIDPAALARLKGDVAFQEQLRKIKSNVLKPNGSGEYMDALEFFDKGHGGAKKQRAWTEGMTGVYEGMTNMTLAHVQDSDLAANLSPTLVARRPEIASYILKDKGLVDTVRASKPDAYRAVQTQAFGATFDPASGAMLSVDSDKLKAAISANQDVVLSVAGDVGGNAVFGSAFASSLDDKAVSGITKSYKMTDTDPIAREELELGIVDAVMEATDAVLADASAPAPVKAQASANRKAIISEINAANRNAAGAYLQSKIQALTPIAYGTGPAAASAIAKINKLQRLRNLMP